MYERRDSVRGGAIAENYEDQTLAVAYKQFAGMYKLYQQVALTMDRRYIPQLVVGTATYNHPGLERYHIYWRKYAVKPLGMTLTENDQWKMDKPLYEESVKTFKTSLKNSIEKQWKEFTKLCNLIVDNLYVQQFYRKPRFHTLNYNVQLHTSEDKELLGDVYFPTQESHLTQYRIPDNLEYHYNGKPPDRPAASGDDEKRSMLLDKLLKFETAFP